MRIAIIGAGNMGGAIACGLVQGRKAEKREVIVANPHNEKLQALQARFPEIQVTNDNKEAARGADIIIVAVKPWKVSEVLKPIHPQRPQILVSLAAGVTMEQLAQYVDPEMPIFRIIPNTAAAIGQSMTLVSSLAANPKEQQLMLDLLAPLGPTMLVPEDQLNAATALASCGTAYVMKYIQAATQAGIELGLSASDARWLTTQCVLGAAALLQDNPDAHPATEIEKVCTPGGYTIRGINELEHAGFTSAIIRAIKASV